MSKSKLPYRYLLVHGQVNLIDGRIEAETGSRVAGVGKLRVAQAGDQDNPTYLRCSESHRLDVLFPNDERLYMVDEKGQPIESEHKREQVSKAWYPTMPPKRQGSSGQLS